MIRLLNVPRLKLNNSPVFLSKSTLRHKQTQSLTTHSNRNTNNSKSKKNLTSSSTRSSNLTKTGNNTGNSKLVTEGGKVAGSDIHIGPLNLSINPGRFTKAVLIMGGFMGAGDLFYQLCFLESSEFSPIRTLTMFLIGSLITGPPTQTFQMLLENSLPGNKRSIVVLTKAIMATLWIFGAYMPILFAAKTILRKNEDTGAYDGKIKDVSSKLQDDFQPHVNFGTAYWPTVFTFVFQFVKIVQRPIVNSFFTTCWNFYVEAFSNRNLPWQMKEPDLDQLIYEPEAVSLFA